MSNETELHEKIVLEGAERAEGHLTRIAGAASRVARSFEGLSEIVGVLGGIGAAWKIGEGLEEANKLYGAVGRISRLTGLSAESAHGMFEAFEKAGVELESAESVMVSMARMAGKMEGSVAVGAQQAAEMAQRMERLGVNVKRGPTEQMLAMAEAAQKGKLGLQDLVSVFGVQRTQAERMLLMLKRGPEQMKELFHEVAGESGVITAESLAAYGEMKKARYEMSQAWQNISMTLYKSVIPIVTGVLHTIKSMMESIEPVAAAIGRTLSNHMELVVGLTKTWVGLLAANKVIGMVGGGKMPLIGEGEEKGRLARVFGGAMNFLGNTRGGKAGGLDYFAAKEASAGVGMFERAGGPLQRILGSVAGKFGIIALVVGALVGAFEILKNNTLGLRSALVGALSGIWDHLKVVFKAVADLFGVLMEALKPIVMILGGAFVIAITVVAKVVEALAWVLEQMIRGMIWLYNKTLAHLPGISHIDLDEVVKSTAKDAKRGSGETTNASVYQDFRGSKFEIENNFPQSIDGGRVAVAFGDELARLGERRIDSGLRPLYSYR